MNKQFIEAKLQKSGDKITFVASDETLDRAGEVIPISSWDLTNFMLNPVLLVDHNSRVENIVGLAKNIRFEEKKLLFDPEFHNITEAAKMVKQMVQEEILTTVSVGFIPHGPVNELLEISFVSLPANPQAQRLKGMAEQVTDEEKMKVKAWAENEEKKLDHTEVDKAQLEEEVKELLNENKDLAEENIQLKEGRVLSGQNRKRIEDAVSILKQASEALDELLNATESNAEKDAGKSRETKVDDGARQPVKVPSRVRRALQSLNKQTNVLLNETK